MMKRSRIFRGILILLGVWLTFDLVARFWAEILWFEELGYLSSWFTRFKSQLGLGAIAGLVSALFALGNLALADRLKRDEPPPGWERPNAKPPPLSQFSLKFAPLLWVVGGLCLLIGLMAIHYGQSAYEVWQRDFSLPSISPPLPDPFNVRFLLGELPQRLFANRDKALPLLVTLGGIATLLLTQTRVCLRAIALGMSLLFGFILAGNWARVLQALHAIPFDRSEPIYHNDISFYIYELPLWQLLYFWLGGLCLYSLIACLLVYLLSGHSLSQGKFPGFSPSQLRHLAGLAGAVMTLQATQHWFRRYELLYSTKGVVYGVGFTDFYIRQPVELSLFFLAVAIAVWLLLRMLGTQPGKIFPKPQLRGVMGLYVTIALLIGFIFPALIQTLEVQPNELARETFYLRQSIAATRKAFALDGEYLDVETFNPQASLTPAKLADNELTVDNIRLWDTRPFLTTIRQLQQIRLYYSFPEADADRYAMQLEPGGAKAKQQVILAARELDYNALSNEAKTWVNEHLVYTHGYGFTVSPVNQVGPGGLPDYFVRDIGTALQEGILLTSNDLVEKSIPIENPRIYYGEMTENYIMTPTKVQEFDFPSGNENVYNTYEGEGGIPLNSWWRRLLFAEYLRDWQMLFTDNFRPDTRVLFRRDINRRLRAIAPFLRYDLDPYLVSVDTGDATEGPKNYLYWIVDAYTTSDRYPYSDPGNYPFNYIRNSVKVVINAYNGNVDFYVADPDDPIVQSWQNIFPHMFKPLKIMPASLRAHLRYPADLLKVQSERLLIYHMTDPTVFYNREDQWQIPQEIYGTESQPVEPYHLIVKLPQETQEEFILLQPFTPTARPNLIAWLAARSDGEQYGKLLLYQFPKQKLVYGIGQIEALINQDPVISQLISLWDTQGSKAIQGNLLVIPIEDSLLYVEPLYLEAEKNGLPTLVRVIVAYDNKIAIAQTLQQALEQIFSPSPASTAAEPNPGEIPDPPAIIRRLDELPR